MKKRLFALFLALTMLLGMLPVTAAAKEEKLYGEVPMYLGYADVDYMAEQVLKEIKVTGDTDKERIRQVYDWIIYNCDRSGSADKAYFDPDEVMEKSQEGSKFFKSMVEGIKDGDLTLRIDVAGEMGSPDGFTIPYDSSYYIASFAYQMMMYRVGNCAHYAALLNLLLNHLGYDCRLIDGDFINSNGSKVEHKWNMVLVDGKYYWLDPRMDHSIYESTGKINYTYFMVEDTAQWEKKHEWDHSYSDAMMESAPMLLQAYGLQLAIPGVTEEAMKHWSNCSGWAEPYLEKSLEKEIYPDVFVLADMTQAVTRAEFASVAVLFYQALTGDQVKLDEEQENPFSDVTAEDKDVLMAYQLGIVNGMGDGTFGVNGTLTREQAVTMLGRVVELAEDGKVSDGSGLKKGKTEVAAFTDDARIGSWAKNYVAYFVSHGVVNGMTDGSFAPAANMTREQAMKVAVEALDK